MIQRLNIEIYIKVDAVASKDLFLPECKRGSAKPMEDISNLKYVEWSV
jgi:hypothetical protein